MLQKSPNSQDIIAKAQTVRLRAANKRSNVSFMLDPSCLHVAFDQTCQRERNIGYYSHRRYRGASVSSFLTVNETNAERVLSFLCSSKTVVTPSYHGALWAAYMNNSIATSAETVKILPFPASEWPISARPVPGAAAKLQCRKENQEFYSEVVQPVIEFLSVQA